jgi:predicted nucleic acid-binding protein
MSDKPPSKPIDPLLLDKQYTDPMAAFLFQPKSIEEIKDTCLVFLDASMLMLPYDTGQTSLKELQKLYEKLAKEQRIFLPRRAIQEFNNRATRKVSEIYHKLQEVGDITSNQPAMPGMLRELEEFTPFKEAEINLNKAIESYQKHFDNLLLKISSWNDNDPVRSAYQAIFTNSNFADFEVNEAVEKEWNYRKTNRVPPGYMDGAKSNTGIGDFLVWRAILAKSIEKNSDALFVTNDTKEDIWVGRLFARSEMVEEFRAATQGKTIRLLQPKDFMTLFGASPASIADVSTVPAEELWTAPSQRHEFLHYKHSTHSNHFLEELQDAARSVVNYLEARENIKITEIEQRKNSVELSADSSDTPKFSVQWIQSYSSAVVTAVDRASRRHVALKQNNTEIKSVLFLCCTIHDFSGTAGMASAIRLPSGLEVWIGSFDDERGIRFVKKFHAT